MIYRLFSDDSKRPLADKIRTALSQADRPQRVGVPAGAEAPADVDGVPVGVTTSGLVLQPAWFEFGYQEVT
jgi:hypothetical protein